MQEKTISQKNKIERNTAYEGTRETTEAHMKTMEDIGMLISTDPIAIDQACIDLVYAATDDPGQAHLLERIESRNGVHTIDAAEELGFGTRDYEMILL